MSRSQKRLKDVENLIIPNLGSNTQDSILTLCHVKTKCMTFYQVKKEDRNNHDDVFVKVFDLDLPPEVKNEDDKDNHDGTEN